MARYGERTEVYVVPYGGSTLKYGFLTSVSAASRTKLGHLAVDRANLPAGLAFGVNAPKPGRATKLTATGSESSYYDISKAGELKTDGWSTSFPTIRRGKAGRKSICVYVTLGTIKYAWMQNRETNAKIAADMAALGISEGSADDRDLVFGARFPVPLRGYKLNADNTIVSTFIDPSKADSLPDGWSTSAKEFVQGVAGADGG